MKDHEIAQLVNHVTAIAKQYAGTQQLRARIANVLVPELKAQPVQRITEQDAREILESYWNSHDDAGDWLNSEDGKLLLDKLNEHREPEETL